MGESHTLFRLVIFIGFVLLFSSVLSQPWVYVGEPLPPNSTWGQFSTGIQNFPQFNNPFSQQFSNSTTFAGPFGVVGSNYGFAGTVVSFVGCANTSQSRYKCLSAQDDEYIRFAFNETASPSDAFVTFNNTYADLFGRDMSTVRRYSWTVSCRTESGTAPLVFPFSIGVFGARIFCPPFSRFAVIQSDLLLPSGIIQTPMLNPDGTDMSIGAANEGTHAGVVDIDYIRLDVTFETDPSAPTTCQAPQGAWFPALDETACAILSLGDTLFKIGAAIVNGIIFIAQVIIWFVSIVGIFFGALLGLLSVPGAPPLISGMIGILVIGSIFFIAIVIMGKVRGTGNVG